MTQFGGGGSARVLGPLRHLHRQREPRPCPEDLPLPRCRARQGRGLPVRQREHLRQDPRQRPREGRLPRPADEPPGQPVDHGTADHDRRLQAGERRPDHGRHPVLRLRPVGQEGPAARPDHGPAHRRHDHGGRRRSGPDDGPPPGPDPGLLQHPGRRADGRPHPVELLPDEAPRGPRGRHRPRLRQAGPDVRRAARRAAGDHREAPGREPRPGRADERHRRRARQAGDHRRRRGRHRRDADRDRPRPRARGRQRDLRLRDPRRAVRPGGRADPGLRASRRSS